MPLCKQQHLTYNFSAYLGRIVNPTVRVIDYYFISLLISENNQKQFYNRHHFSSLNNVSTRTCKLSLHPAIQQDTTISNTNNSLSLRNIL